jgi:hypothetical protein
LLTLRVNHQTRRFCPHRGSFHRCGAIAQSSNCRIQDKGPAVAPRAIG